MNGDVMHTRSILLAAASFSAVSTAAWANALPARLGQQNGAKERVEA